MAQDEVAVIASYDGSVATAGRPKPPGDRGRNRPMVRLEIGIRDFSEDIPIKKDGAGGRLYEDRIQTWLSDAYISRSEYFVDVKRIYVLDLRFS